MAKEKVGLLPMEESSSLCIAYCVCGCFATPTLHALLTCFVGWLSIHAKGTCFLEAVFRVHSQRELSRWSKGKQIVEKQWLWLDS